MQLGLSSYSYSWASERGLTPQRLARIAVEKGVSLLQFGDNMPLHTQDESVLSALASYAGKLEFHMGTAGIAPEHILRYAQIGERLGAKLMRTLLPGGMTVEVLTDALLTLVPTLKRAGIRLAIENYEKYTLKAYAKLFSALPEEQFGLCLDTANNLGNGESVTEFLDLLAPRVICLHIKDIRAKRLENRMGFIVQGAPAGEGIIDIPNLLKRVYAVNPNCPVILEQWPPACDTEAATLAQEEAWVNQGLNYLRAQLKLFEETA